MIYEPFPYQLAGAEWLASRVQALLADDMGLGKTSQAIRASDIVCAQSILVLCPAAARINWEREFHRFSPFDRPAAVVLTGSDPIESGGLTVTSYDLLANKKLYAQLMATEWDALVLDEAHFLKERTSKRTKAVYGNGRKQPGLISRAKRCWRLTGTPVPNNAGELWTHLRSAGVIDMPYWDFVMLYCAGFQSDYGFKITGHKNTEHLKQLLAQFMLRRKKEDVLTELPPIVFSEVTVERSDVQLDPYFYDHIRYEGVPKFLETLKQYDSTLRGALAVTSDTTRPAADSMTVLEGLATSMTTLRRYISLAKLPKFVETIKEELDAGAYEKIVIFAIFKDTIELCREALRKYGAVTLYGGTPPDKRQRHIDRFQNDPTCQVFIANIAAAGTAITLTAANQVAFIEADWVPANNAQAAMRVHRIGQEKKVRVRFFSCAGSVDEYVMKVLTQKTREIVKIVD